MNRQQGRPRIFLLLLLASASRGIWGCTPTKEVERVTVRDTLYAVASPIIRENLPATVTDSLVSAFRAEGKDTIVDVRFFPIEKRIQVTARPDSVYIVDHDTVIQTQYVKTIPETPLLSKVGLVFVGVLVAAVSALILKLRGII
jgi:hypothetical protein